MAKNELVLPIFKTDNSFLSILTLEENSPRSIFTLSKKYNIEEIFLLEKWPSGFQSAMLLSQKLNQKVNFGLDLTVCSDMNDKSEGSRITESRIGVWALNEKGYNELIRLFSFAACEGKYYIPRIDWRRLKERWSENLTLTIPFYNSFIFQNYLGGKRCLYEPPTQGIFLVEENGLPFDYLLENRIRETAKNIIEAKSIYYEKKDDFLAYQTYRIIVGRKGNGGKTLNKPGLDHFCSDRFCLEDIYGNTDKQ